MAPPKIDMDELLFNKINNIYSLTLNILILIRVKGNIFKILLRLKIHNAIIDYEWRNWGNYLWHC